MWNNHFQHFFNLFIILLIITKQAGTAEQNQTQLTLQANHAENFRMSWVCHPPTCVSPHHTGTQECGGTELVLFPYRISHKKMLPVFTQPPARQPALHLCPEPSTETSPYIGARAKPINHRGWGTKQGRGEKESAEDRRKKPERESQEDERFSSINSYL